MGGLLDYLRDYGSGVKQRFGLLADNPAEFTRQALLDVVPNRDEALAAQARLMGGQVDPQAYQSYMNKMQDIGGLLGSIRVYHGSPHKFDKFDLSKIGTGEGNQAFGDGGYFADNRAVAEGYKKALETYHTTLNGKPVTPDMPEFGAAMHIAANGYDAALAQAKRELDSGFINREYAERMVRQIESLKDAKIRQVGKGNLYEADLRWPDAAREAADPLGPQHFLDWDKPMNQQSASVRKAWQQTRKGLPHNAVDDLGGDFSLLYGNDVTPSDFLGTLKSIGGRSDFGEQLLRQQGIPGIRYLDAGSRGPGQGTSNYVVFDDALIDILTRNGIPVKK